jgi:predicted Zn finger-like uncharacterized protein
MEPCLARKSEAFHKGVTLTSAPGAIRQMILTCPTCAARFVIDPRAIGPSGRIVRCGKCKNQWHAEAPLVTIPSSIFAPPGGASAAESSATSSLSAKNGKNGKTGKVEKTGETESATRFLPPWRSVVFAAVAALVVMFPFFTIKIQPYVKATVQAVQPKKAPVKAKAVILEGTPTTLLRQEEGRPVLNIEGVLVNKSGELHKVPVLKASALNALGHVVREWTIPLSAQQLEAGQRLPFSFTTPLPDQGVEDIAFNLL